jgi:hypothetical protein
MHLVEYLYCLPNAPEFLVAFFTDIGHEQPRWVPFISNGSNDVLEPRMGIAGVPTKTALN